MDLAWIVSAVLFAAATSVSPGPNNAMVAASEATWGFRRTVPHMLGITLGFPAMLVMVAFGAGEILRSTPWIHDVLRWAGAAYLLWLAWQIATATSDVSGHAPGRRPMGLIGAALFQVMNPKAWVIAAGAVVTYTTQQGHFAEQIVLLAGIFMAVCVPATAIWTLVGAGAARGLRTPRARQRFNQALAGLLVLSLWPVLLDR